ncbi:Pre-mRNA-splicing factor CWC21 [Intoshia linei]|uniref:Pre-mRNA-splicing factor CWC21 n=1 Tax=Intoshia linei TaxID=1819745 RepID=A0A177B192_9BILA|nr:Pre-mRNA-splicing factor CWC21 [Intoshia linei]
MYNGIGLPTPRGSGTSGHITRNLSSVSDKLKEFRMYDNVLPLDSHVQYKVPNKDILIHEKKRKIESKCLEYEEQMEEQGYSEDHIQTKLVSFRKLLEEDDSLYSKIHGQQRHVKSHDTRTVSDKLTKNDLLKRALNIKENFVDGSSLNIIAGNKEAAAQINKQIEPKINRDNTNYAKDQIRRIEKNKQKLHDKEKIKRKRSTSSEESSESTARFVNNSKKKSNIVINVRPENSDPMPPRYDQVCIKEKHRKNVEKSDIISPPSKSKITYSEYQSPKRRRLPSLPKKLNVEYSEESSDSSEYQEDRHRKDKNLHRRDRNIRKYKESSNRRDRKRYRQKHRHCSSDSSSNDSISSGEVHSRKKRSITPRKKSYRYNESSKYDRERVQRNYSRHSKYDKRQRYYSPHDRKRRDSIKKHKYSSESDSCIDSPKSHKKLKTRHYDKYLRSGSREKRHRHNTKSSKY